VSGKIIQPKFMPYSLIGSLSLINWKYKTLTDVFSNY